MAWRRSPGGLVTAIEPVMRANDGAWIGWPGGTESDIEPLVEDGLSLVPIPLSSDEVEEYYEGFSNATLWPLYHDVVAKPEFHREWWDSYLRVNRRFAEEAAEVAAEGATVWVQDYQLQLVPAMLRELRPDLRIGFFLHIPFPPPELFLQLPWRRQILEGLLGADLVGFQRPGAAQNFVRLVRQRVGHKTHRDQVYLPDGRVVQAGAFPISIDAKGLDELARSEPVQQRAKEIRDELGNPQARAARHRPARLHQGHLRPAAGLQRAGRRRPRSTSRTPCSCRSRRPHASGSSSTASCATTSTGWSGGSTATSAGSAARPSPTCTTSYPREEMAALYRAADVMVVTPLRDGMNLVAKEYVACRYDDDGALVLSEFAGAADELRQAYLVNPYDINGMKQAIVTAMNADPRELARRMKAMRKTVAEHDVKDWAEKFLSVLADAKPLHHKQLRPSSDT